MEDEEYIANELLSCGPFVAPPAVPVKIKEARYLKDVSFIETVSSSPEITIKQEETEHFVSIKHISNYRFTK